MKFKKPPTNQCQWLFIYNNLFKFLFLITCVNVFKSFINRMTSFFEGSGNTISLFEFAPILT